MAMAVANCHFNLYQFQVLSLPSIIRQTLIIMMHSEKKENLQRGPTKEKKKVGPTPKILASYG